MSCMVTTTDSTSPCSERMGVTLSSTLTLRPSGTAITISSARTVSLETRRRPRDNPCRENSLPSARRTFIDPSRSSRVWPGSSRLPTMRRASRLCDASVPVFMSNTTTPTGEVSMSVSRPARARCSSRWLRALAIT